jgi:hypothetical protein
MPMGDDTMRKSTVFILVLCLLSVAILTGCTSEDHRVLVTIENDTNNDKNIQLHIDDNLELTASLGPKESVEEEFELSQGSHSFKVFHEVNGTYVLFQERNADIEADSSLFFQIE